MSATVTIGTGGNVAADVAHCVHCHRTDFLVVDDGPVIVCRPCIDLLGGAARDPMSVTVRLREHLRARHRTVVVLLEGGANAVWAWVADWPGVVGR